MAAGGNGSKGAATGPARRLRIPLSLKFAAVTVALVALLLLASAAISLWQGYTEAERSALAIQQTKAEALAGRVGSVLGGLETQLAWTAQPEWKTAGIEQQRADFARMLQQFPAVTELFQIDAQAAEQLKVSRFAPDSIASQTSHANEPRFLETVKAGTWFGPVYVRNGAELSGTVGVAHQDGGATIAELDLAFINDLTKAVASEGQQAFVVDDTGRLIGHPDRNPVTGDNDLSGLPQVAAALAADGIGTSTDAVLEGDAGSAFAAFAPVPGAGWRAITQQSKAEALAPFWSLLGQSAILGLAGLAIALLAGISMARRVSVPIRKLQASAELLGEGDLAQRVDVRRRDEIGILADRFNTMANRLQQNRKGLEAAADDQAEGLDIAQQQHGLTVDMLKTISRTDYRLERVLDTLIGSAVRLTEANVGAIWVREGDAFRLAAQLGHTNDWVEAARKAPFTAGSEAHAMAAAAAYSGQVINVDDVLRDVRFAGDYGERPAYSDERSALALPLKHAGKVVAVFALSRGDPLPFSERQVSLAQDFSDQALIAIRHVLLLEEVETRDRRLALSSDEQAATDEIARLIAKSPANAKAALDKIARSAARFLDAPCCHIEQFDGARLHFKAGYGLTHEAIELLNRAEELAPGTPAAHALETGAVAEMQSGEQAGTLSALLGSKSSVAVPLLKEGNPIGVLTVEREETGDLPARQIELLKTFADQAAIAIESARLSEELRTRTSRLADVLVRETATGALLQTVSRTDYDLRDVLTELAARATRECAADDAQFFRLDGEVLRDASGAEAAVQGHAGLARRIVAEPAAVNVPDIRQNSDLAGKDAANRSMLGLPLLAKGVVVGVMTLSRRQAQPFDDEQMKLAAEFADQAALAVAGMQLPAELAERTAERDDWRQRHAADTDTAERRRLAEVEEARRLHVTEVAETKERYETDLGEARHLHETDVAEARRLHTTEVAETRERYEAELGEARRLHAEDVAERTAERDEWQQRHTTDTDAAEQRRVAEIEEARQSHAAELNEARRLHVADVQEAHQRREADLAEADKLHAEELDSTIKAHAAAFAETLTAHAGELAETNRTHADELAEARQVHAAELGEARALHAGDLDLARLQRTATAEALKHVADPSAGLDAVLQAIVDSATRASGADAGVLFTQVGDWIKAEITSGLPDEEHEATLAALRDALAADVIAQGKPLRLTNVPATGAAFGAALGVPLLKDGAAHGALVLLGPETGTFGGEVAALAESFADQAVIAIETERLLELAALRANQLDEARRFREAAARTLDTVGSVEADPQQALDAVVTMAAELCRAQAVELSLAEGDALRRVASAGATDGDVSVARRAIAEGRTLHVTSDSADAAGPGATLALPLMLGDKAAGALTLQREASAFNEREIELATTLAAQAAIAIAKARLAVTLAERNRSLDQALNERKTTANMLAMLGRSRFDLRAVLDTLARSAAELGGAGTAAICLHKGGGALENAGSVGFSQAWPGDGRHPEAASLAEHVIREAAPLYLHEDSSAGNLLAVPINGTGKAIGALVVSRPTPFGDEDVAVVSTLADQAAIAVENVRLLDEVAARTAEVNEALRQQVATAGGLSAINRSGFDLGHVLSGMAASAASLCGAGTSTIHLLRDGAYHVAAATGLPAERVAEERANPSRPGRSSWVGRTALDKAVIHVPDEANDIEYPEIAKAGGAVLSVPLLRDGALVGVFTLTRSTPGAFSERHVALVQNFADQAAIADETVRLSDEVSTRTAEVNETLRQQTAVAFVLRTMGRSAFDLDRVLSTLAASAATLCNTASSEIYRLEDGSYRLIASTGTSQLPALDGWIRRAAHEKAVIHVPDLGVEAGSGTGAMLCVPLLREDAVGGIFALTRSGPFTDRQIELVRSFADQAVIAIEGARLADAARASADELADSMRDLHALQKRVGEMERLATLGQTTSGIAAEIRGSLDSLKDFSTRSDRVVNDIRMVLESAVLDLRIREEVEELGDTLKANLDKVVEFGKRADSVVVNVLHLDKGQDTGPGERRPVDINTLVDESLGIAHQTARAERPDIEVRIERTYDAAAGIVDVHPQEIARALLHIFTNGFQAIVRRKAEMNGSGYQPMLATSTKNLGDAVEITIRDNGTGIPPEVKARMFDPFFTNRPAGEGTGLGLSLSRDIIVTEHAGTIEVETEPGSFTEFRIVLPRGTAKMAKGQNERASDASFETPLLDVLSALRN